MIDFVCTTSQGNAVLTSESFEEMLDYVKRKKLWVNESNLALTSFNVSIPKTGEVIGDLTLRTMKADGETFDYWELTVEIKELVLR